MTGVNWAGVVAAVGSGLIGGVFLVFSVSIMPAFARLEKTHGIAVMQAINLTIVRSPFVVVFIGTVAACVLQVVLEPADVAGWIGAALYVLGTFGVTIVGNVPLNNRLDRTDLADPEDFWAVYARRWTTLNHVRTVAGIGAAVALTLAAGS
jgi:uncharacterized membrane protein